jgi:hypothetical protein
LRRAAAALSWGSALYLLGRVSALYLGIGGTRRHHVESAAFGFVLALAGLVLTARPPDDPALREPADDRPIQPFVWGVALLAGSLVLYGRLLSTGLFADDYVIVEAALRGDLTVWRELFRPIIFVLWRPLAAATGMPGPFLHALNIVLHAANALLVAILAQRILQRHTSAAVAGLLFLCMPAGLEAIAWPSGLQDVLMTGFVLSFLTAATVDRTSWPSVTAASIALIAGLLTKETAIAAPLLAALVGIAAGTPEARRGIWKTAALSTAAIVAYGAIRLALIPLPGAYGGHLSRYGIKELLVRPFATLVVPLRVDETQAAPLAAILLVTLVAVALRIAAGEWDRRARRLRVALLGGAMVLAAAAPLMSLFYIDPDLLGSRYLYLAQAGWAIALAAILDTAGQRLRPVGLFLPVLVSLWVFFGERHVTLWIEAGRARDTLLAAAGRVTFTGCQAWAVYDLPATIRGVPVFINGFPEAAKEQLPGHIRVAPTTLEPGECRIRWDGEQFVRE